MSKQKLKSEQRKERVRRMNDQGMTLIDIASHEGVSRQRIQQIERSMGIVRRDASKSSKINSFKCKTCGKAFGSYLSGRKYCSRKCFAESLKLNLTEKEIAQRAQRRKEANRARAKDYYHNVLKKNPNWREITRERNMRAKKRK